MNRVSVYIDNSNVFKNIRTIREMDGDYSWVALYNPLRLAEKLSGGRELSEVHFYCVPPPHWLLQEDESHKKKHATASKYYSAISKLPKVEIKYGYLQGSREDPREKNVDTQLSCDMVADAALGKYDTAIIVSNDGDFTSAINNVKKLGKRVEALFFRGYISGALRRSCDLERRARKSHFELLDIE